MRVGPILLIVAGRSTSIETETVSTERDMYANHTSLLEEGLKLVGS